MGTLGDKFSYLIATKNLMKTVLRNKGQSVSDDATFRSYVDKINNLVPPPSGTINIGQNGAHDVSNYANANVSVQPTLQTKNVSPSTSQQSITPDQNYDGLSEVIVSAIQTETKTVKSTASSQTITPTSGKFIDEITVDPIDLESKTVTPTTSQQTITPSSGKDGLDSVTIGAVDNTIDNNIVSGNIKSGATILGVSGSSSVVDTDDANALARYIREGNTAYVNGVKVTGTAGIINTVRSADITTFVRSDKYKNGTDVSHNDALYNIKLDNGLIGFISPAQSSVEGAHFEGSKVGTATKQEYVAEKIGLDSAKLVSGNTILGVSGTAVELQGETRTVAPTTSQQILTPSSGKNGMTQVTIGAVDNTIDNNIVPGNIKSGVTILGVSGSSSVVDTSDVNAAAADIVKGKTAYVNGTKVTGTYDISAEELMASYMAINALPFNHNIYQIFSDMAQDGTADYSLHTITYSPTDVYMYLDYIKTYEWIYLMSFPYAPEIVGTLQSLYTSAVSSYYFYHDASYYNFDGTTSIEITQGIYKVTFTVIISNDRISNVSLSVYNTSANTTEYSVSANINFTPGGGDMPTTIQGDGDTVSKAIYMMLKNTPISNIKITSSALNSSSDIERICNECAHLIDDYIKLITETE